MNFRHCIIASMIALIATHSFAAELRGISGKSVEDALNILASEWDYSEDYDDETDCDSNECFEQEQQGVDGCQECLEVQFDSELAEVFYCDNYFAPAPDENTAESIVDEYYFRKCSHQIKRARDYKRDRPFVARCSYRFCCLADNNKMRNRCMICAKQLCKNAPCNGRQAVPAEHLQNPILINAKNPGDKSNSWQPDTPEVISQKRLHDAQMQCRNASYLSSR